METFLGGRLLATQGDITEMSVDAIVNAANSTLLGGGGVDGAIHRKGGPEILEDCRRIRTERYPDGMPAGNAVMTTGGRLACKHVIHTVGPVWHGGGKGEVVVLSRAYSSSLAVATENGLATVAFPAISTGVYRFPRELAARTAFAAIRDHLAHNELPERVYLVFFSQSDRETFIGALENPG